MAQRAKVLGFAAEGRHLLHGRDRGLFPRGARPAAFGLLWALLALLGLALAVLFVLGQGEL